MTHQQASLFLFLEGFASIAIQFLVLRQLTPFTGSSIIITSLVVSLFLGSLALGYRKGGRVKEHHSHCLSRNLIKASIIMGIFCSYSFLELFFRVLHNVSILISTFLYLLLFMAPIVYWVGQTIPLMVNFVRADTSSQKAGDALLFSTVGNVAGGIITTLLIMYYLGVSWAILITISMLTLLSFMVSPRKKLSAMLAVVTLISAFVCNVYLDSSNFLANNSYANYQTFSSIDNEQSYFVSNNSFASLLNRSDGSGFPYIEQIKKIMKTYGSNTPDEQTLVIGAGGFSLTANNDIQSRVHYVDIDSAILELAEKYFLQEQITASFSGMDARVFLRNSKDRYDFIIVDAYANKSSIPGSLTTSEFYQAVSAHLNKNGIMISNVIANPFMTDKFSRRISNTIEAAFQNCYRSVIPLDNKSANILFVCSNQWQSHDSKVLYRDNNTQSIVDFFMKNNP